MPCSKILNIPEATGSCCLFEIAVQLLNTPSCFDLYMTITLHLLQSILLVRGYGMPRPHPGSVAMSQTLAEVALSGQNLPQSLCRDP